MPARLDPRYVAGVLDVRGCMEIRTRKGLYSTSMVRVHLAERSLLDALMARYGGRINPDRRRRSWRWTICSREMLAMLEDVMPHMLVKREEAAAAILLQREVTRTTRQGRIDARGRQVRVALEARLRAARARRGIRASHPSS